jgi:hypothetical protein
MGIYIMVSDDVIFKPRFFTEYSLEKLMKFAVLPELGSSRQIDLRKIITQGVLKSGV